MRRMLCLSASFLYHFQTTEIYTHVSKNAIDKIRNPVDDLFD
jgi:hypothetical protein